MKIEVNVFATLRLKLGIASVELETDAPVTVREMLTLTDKKTGKDVSAGLLENDSIRKGTLILIDGKNVIHMDNLDTVIKDDCLISLFPPAGGG